MLRVLSIEWDLWDDLERPGCTLCLCLVAVSLLTSPWLSFSAAMYPHNSLPPAQVFTRLMSTSNSEYSRRVAWACIRGREVDPSRHE